MANALNPRYRDANRIRPMLEAARRAVHLAEGVDSPALAALEERAPALVRGLKIFEAVRSVSSTVQNTYPAVPWRLTGDRRNPLIHDYAEVDMRIVETIIWAEWPRLIPEQSILRDLEQP